ncbi:MAG: hypothetical protein NT015_07125 [Alphaproteobacteria bacterium]|nr:hypothetical protein [Alphaproteobacteria bacterium]
MSSEQIEATLAGMNRRVKAASGLFFYLIPWVVLGPSLRPQFPNLWLVFVLGLLFFLGMGVLALRGKFDDPTSPYVRAIKIVATGALAVGTIFLAYTWVTG